MQILIIMKTTQSKIISASARNIKASLAHKEKVKNIKKAIKFKYHDSIKNEHNLFKKIVVIIKRKVEINQKINELTSLDKLYYVI